MASASWRLTLLADLACALGLLGFALALVAPVLAGGVPVAADTLALWGPPQSGPPIAVHNQMLADSALVYLPWQVFIRRSLAHGEWPLWYPDVFAGFPFAGNPQTQLYYPVMWLLWLLPLALALQVGTVFHLWLAGAGMYVLARMLGASRGGSLLAGLAFGGSGYLYTAIELSGIADIYGWLPWVLAASEVAWRRRSWGWTAGAGVLFAILGTAGHVQWFVYSTLLLGGWLAARVAHAGWTAWRDPAPASRRHWRGQALRAAALLAWGPALIMVQILPFLELLQRAPRLGLDTLVAYEPLNHTLRLLVPRFFGTPIGNIGEPLVFNAVWYIGLAPLALALIALPVRRERRVLFLWLVGAGAWCMATGVAGFDMVQRLPGFQAQLPQRIAYLFIFCAAPLAGLGFDGLLALARRYPRRATALVAGLLGIGAALANGLAGLHAGAAGVPDLYRLQDAGLRQAALIAGALLVWLLAVLLLRGNRRWWGRALLTGGLLGLTVVDLLTYLPDYNTFVAPQALQPHAPAADVIAADPDPARIIGPDSPGPVFVPDSATLYGLQDVQGYDSLHLSRYEDYWAAADPSVRGGGYFNVVLRPQSYLSAQARLLNVKYIPLAQSPLVVRQPQAERTITELAGRPVTQTLRTPEALTTLAVAFDTLGRVDHAPVTLHIRRSLTETHDLLTQTVDPVTWTGQPWYKFAFAPLPVHQGEPLTIILESPAGSEGDSVAVRVSQGDSYPGGVLYRNGAARALDLAFTAKGNDLPPTLSLAYSGPVSVYTNSAALPRAFTVAGAIVLPAAEIPARIAAPGFDPRAAVLLEQPPPPGFGAAPGESRSPGTATITRYRNLSVEIDARMDRPGWLVLGDVNYPGWQVTVDGAPAPLYAAYYILRGVPLPAGRHTVRFDFRPGSVLLGGAISASALLLATGVIAASALRRGRRRP